MDKYSGFEVIDKSKLKIGDIVGIFSPVKIGQSYFRYGKMSPMTIKKITPARAKFIMTNEYEFTEKDIFYKITDEMERRNVVIESLKGIYDCVNKINDNVKGSKILKRTDDEIIDLYKAAKTLKDLCEDNKKIDDCYANTRQQKKANEQFNNNKKVKFYISKTSV